MPHNHARVSHRLKSHDYTEPGYYFITVCVENRECIVGKVAAGQVELNESGRFVDYRIRECCAGLSSVFVDTYVMMPNHVHILFGVIAVEAEGAKHSRTIEIEVQGHERANAWPLQGDRPARGTKGGSIGAIVQNLKSVTSRGINRLRGTLGCPVWQRDYYDHVVRDVDELDRIRTYIEQNPARWNEDKENPENQS